MRNQTILNYELLCRNVVVVKLLSIFLKRSSSVLITLELKQFSVTPKRYYTQSIGSNFVSRTQVHHFQSFDTKIVKVLIALKKLTA